MEVIVSDSRQELGRAAAAKGAEFIRGAIDSKGAVSVILATGASQFEMLSGLVAEEGIEWGKVSCFHLDEYVGMAMSHPASFRKYLQERFVAKLPHPPAEFHYVDGQRDPDQECRRLGKLISSHPIDVAFIGIGENGHLAFNDPPADFETDAAFIVLDLDEACRRQQVGEGWFETIEDVPARAISMSIRQIMKSEAIVCSVPDGRKAEAVRATLSGPVGPQVPASILRQHDRAFLYLDRESASLL